MEHKIIFALIPLILSIGIIPAIPFSDAAEQTTKTKIARYIELATEDWVSGRVSDALFVHVIEYLVEKSFISIPYAQAPEDNATVSIPSWFKTNTEFWVKGDISNDEFAKGLEWLINNGIIKIQELPEQLNMPLPVSTPEPEATISARTSYTLYAGSDPIKISGTVNPVLENKDITITITSTKGERVGMSQTTPKSDGTFSDILVAGGPLWTPNGKYIIELNYLSATTQITIKYAGGGY